MTERIPSVDFNRGLNPDDTKILLVAAPNGGWIIYRPGSHPGGLEEIVGAYGNAAEMIAELRGALVDP